MNYLAHVYLAHIHSASVVGNLLGDFCSGSISELSKQYSADVCHGIWMHRQIDKYTDSHPLVIRSKQRIDPRFGLLRGILVDIFYDHYLAKNWRAYSDLPLQEFTRQVYAELDQHAGNLPDRLVRILPYMKQDDWLSSYRKIESIRLVLSRMKRRLSRENILDQGIHELTRNYVELGEDFQAFFTELTKYARTLAKQQ